MARPEEGREKRGSRRGRREREREEEKKKEEERFALRALEKSRGQRAAFQAGAPCLLVCAKLRFS